MDADIHCLVLDLLMACAAARAQRQRCLEAIQRWEEVLIASRRRRLVDALRDVLHLQQTEMRVPVSVERRVAVAVWWMANTMSYRTVGQQFGLARSTVAGIVLEVTRAITERLLDRVVYLHNLDRDAVPKDVPKDSHEKCSG
ncbi:UNVERIFIED_CONTAM: hypothetical protein K2H54_005199 [Gekko kuhli]